MSPILKQVGWIDFIDVLLVAFLIYHLYKIIKGTVAIKIFVGIFAIYLFWKITEALKMSLLSEILGQFIGVGVLALIIVFQQEIRRFLLVIGTTGFVNQSKTAERFFRWTTNKEAKTPLNIDAIIVACEHMGKSLTGALIVIARTNDLGLFSATGDELDAIISNRLLENIFYKNNPLHDGAVIIEKNRIKAARCVLPATENANFPSTLGMRHRAAVGASETTDAIIISLSEQTGALSIALAGKLQQNVSLSELRTLLHKELS